MKDNFSEKSNNYKQFRPNYPSEIFDFVFSKIKDFNIAWDCGTGTGQIVTNLAPHFDKVFATDISIKQIENAEKFDNVEYSVLPAEKTNFANETFDLVIVGQAIHWFDFEKFYQEAKRTSKKDAILVVVGYGRVKINDTIDKVVDQLYYDILGKYWDKERKYIDKNYATIPFPFQEIKTPTFINSYSWSLEHLIGYFETWSAAKHYQKQNSINPVELIIDNLKAVWPENETQTVNFPILQRVGELH